jgi:hypothetical protein
MLVEDLPIEQNLTKIIAFHDNEVSTARMGCSLAIQQLVSCNIG